ncbi:LysM peptidoglycan-binding domain-containing protein [Chlorogloeopsis sp. ULAP02]|uniref:LysM peptidoglycan-binding domain-containing protein n=1 Tax=Chlorogloeopsis sp. ULAP02 TaxID=3107926 RepID=UPI0031359000
MNIKLTCHVCGYTEIEANHCPNCDADLSLIRMLQELPQAEKSSFSIRFTAWQLGATLFILIVGIGLGGLGSFLFLEAKTLNTTIKAPSSVVITTSIPKPSPIPSPASVETSKPTTYTVKSGDHLSSLAEKFCGKGTSWQVMLKANPQLKRRKNYIEIGEVLKIPNCKGDIE